MAQSEWHGNTRVVLGDLMLSNLVGTLSEVCDRPVLECASRTAPEWRSSIDSHTDLDLDRFFDLALGGVFIVALTNVSRRVAKKMHLALYGMDAYVGVTKPSDKTLTQRYIFVHLLEEARIRGKDYRVFADAASTERDEWRLSEIRELGIFNSVPFEYALGCL